MCIAVVGGFGYANMNRYPEPKWYHTLAARLIVWALMVIGWLALPASIAAVVVAIWWMLT